MGYQYHRMTLYEVSHYNIQAGPTSLEKKKPTVGETIGQKIIQGLLHLHHTTVDLDLMSGNKAGIIACKKKYGLGNFAWLTKTVHGNL